MEAAARRQHSRWPEGDGDGKTTVWITRDERGRQEYSTVLGDLSDVYILQSEDRRVGLKPASVAIAASNFRAERRIAL
jgi:hypothetical protein